MPIGTSLKRGKAKVKKPKAPPKKTPASMMPQQPKQFQGKFTSMMDDIVTNTEDLPEELDEDWSDIEDELKPKLAKKNWDLWKLLFPAIIAGGIVQGMAGKPSVPQPQAPEGAVVVPGTVSSEIVAEPTQREVVDYAQRYFEEHGLELCKSLTETDLERIKSDLIQNWGKGPEVFASKFKESYPVSESRLESIYRSERHQSEVSGLIERARLSDHGFKRWEAVNDERTCSICLQFDQEVVPIDEPFSNGEMTSSAHPSCRCTLTTFTDEDYDAMMSDEETI